MPHTCDGCHKLFSERKGLHRHEGNCSKLKEKSDRQWNLMREAEKDPEVRKKRRLAQEELPDNPSNPFERFKNLVSSHKKLKTSRSSFEDNRDRPSEVNISREGADDECPPESSGLMHSCSDEPGNYGNISPSPSLPATRIRRLTERAKAMLEDDLPEGAGDLLEDESTDSEDQPSASSTLRIRIRRMAKTVVNKFGLVRTYHGRPSGIPNSQKLDFVADGLQPHAAQDSQPSSLPKKKSVMEIIHPYPNLSSFLFNRWHWNGGKKTKKNRAEFVGMAKHPDFKIEDILDVNFDRLDAQLAENPGGVVEDNGWKKSSVPIHIPTGKKETKASKRDAAARRRQARVEDVDDPDSDSVEYATGREYFVHGLHHRSMVDIVREVFSSADSQRFHWHPFEEHWTPPWDENSQERVYGDLFSSTTFLEEDRKLQNSPAEPGCDLPRAIAAMMIYSDATHVAQFGQAKLWPIYLFFGNQSKYERGRPSARAGHSVAFLPSLPDSITDFIRNDPSAKVTKPLLAHCRRELFQGCWKIILDDEFLAAYEHGIIVECGDGVQRRIYPRIFIYSADYPEKVLIATIRDKGQCPCPRCKISHHDISHFATDGDMELRKTQARHDNKERQEKVKHARKFIYEKGYVVNSTRVEDLLKEDSLVPTENAFSSRLSQFGFDFHKLLVVDCMHEIELGIWKSLLQHLIRILHTQGAEAVYDFNARFRQVAPFGRSVIRKFLYNVSDLSKLAAHDYEDILQCIIPCIEGLVPSPHNETILDLLYILTYWHSLAKLRMHTDSSVKEFRLVTTLLGEALRYFADETCRHFQTFETEKEYQARKRATARRLAKLTPSLPLPATLASDVPAILLDSRAAGPSQPTPQILEKTGKQGKTFNISTPKAHFFPDYPDQIELHGTTDSLSTKLGESRHSHLKDHNDRTNHNNATPQIIGIDVREAVHARMTAQLLAVEQEDTTPIEETGCFNADELSSGYHIAAEERPSNREFLPEFLNEHQGDAAVTDYIPRLKAHLLARKRGLTFTGEEPIFTDAELRQVVIRDNFLYSHATASFNFTTYDLRRDQDSMNTNSGRCDIMIPSFETESAESDQKNHPYWYARVLKIHHVQVFFGGSRVPDRIYFLWVRWFGRDIEWQGGPSTLRLDRIGFVPSNDKESFGFLDPAIVVRMSHLIPCFRIGRTRRLLGPSLARDSEGDWENYYVMRFADRDMMMRYLGTGVGHHQLADFPGDIGQIIPRLEGGSYIEPTTRRNNQFTSPDLNPIKDSIDDEDMESLYSDGDDFAENIYEL